MHIILKAQFDEGSGITGFIETLPATVGEGLSRAGRAAPYLRSPEEALYHRLFSEAFSDSSAMVPLVGRWTPESA